LGVSKPELDYIIKWQRYFNHIDYFKKKHKSERKRFLMMRFFSRTSVKISFKEISVPLQRLQSKRLISKRLLSKRLLSKRLLSKRLLSKRLLSKRLLSKRLLF